MQYPLPALTQFDSTAIAALRGDNISGKQKQHLSPIFLALENLHLARTGADSFRAWLATTIMACVISLVGSMKLYFGIIRGRPVLFLSILLIGSLISLFLVLKPWETPTRLGRLYLKALEDKQSVLE